MAVAPVILSNVGGPGAPTLLPNSVTAPIFLKAVEQSSVMSLARKVPLSINANTAIPIPGDVPLAGWVSEGSPKPTSGESMGLKTMTGKKVAVLVPVSQEVAMTNPAGLYDQLQQDLPTAIARAFDYAAIHGVDLKTGGASPFNDSLMMTTNTQVIGATSVQNGGIFADIVKGKQQVEELSGFEFSGLAADKRLQNELMLSFDSFGRSLWVPTPTEGLTASTIAGVPAYYTPAVSGAFYRQSNAGGDSGLRAIGGDWSQCAYGVGMDISVKVSTQASYVDSSGALHNAFQDNLVLILAEAYYGFVVQTPQAFVKYTGPVGS